MERFSLLSRVNAFLAAMLCPVEFPKTPRRLVCSLNKTRLYRYGRPGPSPAEHQVPLLLVYAPIGRPDILDLRPGASLVQFLAARGYDVYLLDWGRPGPEDRNQSLEDYVLLYLPRAVRQVQRLSGERRFTLLGWSTSGLFAAAYAALRPDDGIRNLILVAAPLDLTDRSAGLARVLAQRNFDLELLLEAFGNLPGEFLAYAAVSLRPVETTAGAVVQLWDNLSNPEFVAHWRARRQWASDLVPVPGAFVRQLVTDLYRENKLISGDLVLGGERVDLSRIRANLLSIVAEDDFVTPPSQCETILERVSSEDRMQLRLPGNHIEVMAGPDAPRLTWPRLDQWLSPRS